MPLFTGSIAGLVNGDDITATYGVANLAATPAVGTYTITPTLSDPSSRLPNYAVTTNNATLTINPLATTVSVSAPTTSTFGDALSLTATVTDAYDLTPGGTVTFSSGATDLGTATLDAGQATLSLTASQAESDLPAGSDPITAAYTDTVDSNFAPGTSTQTSISVGQATPAIALNFASTYQVGTTIGSDATIVGVSGSPGASLEGVSLVLTYSNSKGSLGTTAPTQVGSYSVVGSFAGSTDYSETSTASFAFTIVSGAVPTITLTAPNELYNDKPYAAATATIMPSDSGSGGTKLGGVGLTLTYYSGSTASGTPLSAAPTNAGTYTVEASYAGGTASGTTYSSNSVTATFTIEAGVVQSNGLQFEPVGTGNTFSVNNGVYTITTGAEFGFAPAGKAAFVPLAELAGTVTIDTNAGTLTGSGTLERDHQRDADHPDQYRPAHHQYRDTGQRRTLQTVGADADRSRYSVHPRFDPAQSERADAAAPGFDHAARAHRAGGRGLGLELRRHRRIGSEPHGRDRVDDRLVQRRRHDFPGITAHRRLRRVQPDVHHHRR